MHFVVFCDHVKADFTHTLQTYFTGTEAVAPVPVVTLNNMGK